MVAVMVAVAALRPLRRAKSRRPSPTRTHVLSFGSRPCASLADISSGCVLKVFLELGTPSYILRLDLPGNTRTTRKGSRLNLFARIKSTRLPYRVKWSNGTTLLIFVSFCVFRGSNCVFWVIRSRSNRKCANPRNNDKQIESNSLCRSIGPQPRACYNPPAMKAHGSASVRHVRANIVKRSSEPDLGFRLSLSGLRHSMFVPLCLRLSAVQRKAFPLRSSQVKPGQTRSNHSVKFH